jgi:FKBP-type peptidyl-prolyl cis-trans isomerase FkpA
MKSKLLFVLAALSASAAFSAVPTAIATPTPAASAAAPAVSARAPATKAETLASGVVVEHLVVGKGASPSATDKVEVHYRGTLTNGTEFDSSYKRGQPISFGLNQVIPCWTQGVQKMKIGGKARLTCPSATAYGERGAGPAVPPNSILNFEVELLGINK